MAAADLSEIANTTVAVAEVPMSTVSARPSLVTLPAGLQMQITAYVVVDKDVLFFFDLSAIRWGGLLELCFSTLGHKYFPLGSFWLPYLPDFAGQLMITKQLFKVGVEVFSKGNKFDPAYASSWLKGIPSYLWGRIQHVELRIDTDTFPDDYDFLHVVTYIQGYLDIKTLKLFFTIDYLQWCDRKSKWAGIKTCPREQVHFTLALVALSYDRGPRILDVFMGHGF